MNRCRSGGAALKQVWQPRCQKCGIKSRYDRQEGTVKPTGLLHQRSRTCDRVKTKKGVDFSHLINQDKQEFKMWFLSVLASTLCEVVLVFFVFFAPCLGPSLVTPIISSARSTSATSACERQGLCVVAWYSPFSWLRINPHYSTFQAHTRSDTRTHTQIGYPDRRLADLEKTLNPEGRKM